MPDRLKAASITLGALVLAALVSHLMAALVGIHTKAASGYKRFGHDAGRPDTLISGSSLTYDAVDWTAVSQSTRLNIESWPVPGSSPAEWESLQRRSPQAKVTFIGVSPYDLNEMWLCDFRADLVPVYQTLQDLWASRSDAAFSKRLLSCYPQSWIRLVYPTVGRSEGILAGLRDKVREVAAAAGLADRQASDGERLRVAADYTSDDAISTWPQDRLLRRLASMRSTCDGRHVFAGPKSLALRRLLRQALGQGSVVVVVLPVSPPYEKELLGPDEKKHFEQALAGARQDAPQANWIRLDQISELNSSEYFYDLVHLNMRGRRIATKALQEHLSKLPLSR